MTIVNSQHPKNALSKQIKKKDLYELNPNRKESVLENKSCQKKLILLSSIE